MSGNVHIKLALALHLKESRCVIPMNSFIVHETPERWLREFYIACIPWLHCICIRYSVAGRPMVRLGLPIASRRPLVDQYQFTMTSRSGSPLWPPMVLEGPICSLSTSALHGPKPRLCDDLISLATTPAIRRRVFSSSVFPIIILQLHSLSHHYLACSVYHLPLTNAGTKPTLRGSISWTSFSSVVLLENLQGIPIFVVAPCIASYASLLISSARTISTSWATREYTSTSMNTNRATRPYFRLLPHISSPSCHLWILRISP